MSGDDFDIVAELLDWCDCDEGCTDCYAAEVIMDLRAERDASRLIINDLTVEIHRLRAAGDALAEACAFVRAHPPEITRSLAAWQEARK